MNGYLVFAYVAGLGLLWGAAIRMLLVGRAVQRRQQQGDVR